jgi:prepilin-type N-terminal cleavage/methylation domain-containing protein
MYRSQFKSCLPGCRLLKGYRGFSRPSFTLVELLVVIAVIGILAGMIMVALAGAQRDASIARTRATVRKISKILLSKYRELSLSPAPIEIPHDLLRPRLLSTNQQPFYPISGRELARTRLISLRHLLRFEIPDRPSDTGLAGGQLPLYLESRNEDGSFQIPNSTVTFSIPIQNSVIFSGLNSNWNVYDPSKLSFPDAKLLYQIIASTTTEESSGLEAFHPNEIGDPDGDGNPEFVDAWGGPIRFIRWPAGAWRWSPVAKESRDAEVYSWAVSGVGWVDQGVAGGDSLDPTRADWRYMDDNRNAGSSPSDPDINVTKLNNPFDLAPLVVSAGSDRKFGLVFSGEDLAGTGPDYGNMPKPSGAPGSGHDNRYRYPDPYFEFPVTNSFTSQPAQIGDPISQEYVDNVSSFDAVEY